MEMPKWATDALTVCQMISSGIATPNIRTMAETTLVSFFQDVSEDKTTIHLSKGGHLECQSTDTSGS